MITHDRNPISQQSGTKYGGFWLRLCAYIIDWVILAGMNYIALWVLAILIGGGEEIALQSRHMDPNQMTDDQLAWPLILSMTLVSIAIPWLYYTLFESSSLQATPGKRALGLKVVDLLGKRISFGRANARFWSKIISTLILYIGFMMIGWTKYKQGLHDKIAHTFVWRS